MIKIDNIEVVGLEPAIRGMRNPKNSWDRSDSRFCGYNCDDCQNFSACQSVRDEAYFKKFWEGGPIDTNFCIGPNDHKLMETLAKGGPVHGKYKRMIVVYMDITAPLYWWKEFDTYKVGTVANSCSTMHKIHDKEFELDDFSHEHLSSPSLLNLKFLIDKLNSYRDFYNNWDDTLSINKHTWDLHERKDAWWQMIQLLPSSYNQKRTVMLNYEVLTNMYHSRKDHRLDEWHIFCDMIKGLPYSELITGE